VETERGYTIAEVREQVGCSDSWLRKHLRRGTFGEIAKVQGSRGLEYRFTQENLDAVAALYTGSGTGGGGGVSTSRSELTALVVRATAEADKWQAIAQERAERLTRLEAQADKDRQRIEALLSLSWWQRLRGKHRDV